MNVLIDINHPAHVHLYRNVYKRLKADGHKVLVVVKDIPAAIKLLELYDIPYINIGHKKDDIILKGLDQLLYNFKIWKIVLREKVDVGLGSSINIPHVSRISKMASVVCDDDDDAAEPLFVKFAHPFSDVVLTPNVMQRQTGHALYVPTYHELSYLHPHWFSPNEAVLSEVGVEKGETYFIVRFNAFKAHHDIGKGGLSHSAKQKLISLLASKGKVFITTERDIDEEFRPYQLKVSPEKIHSLMYYATMLVGDSQTMTTEAALLGTPAIKCNSFAGALAVPNEVEDKYELCYAFLPTQEDEMLKKVQDLLALNGLKKDWVRRRERLFKDKIDYTSFLTWFIEHYPQSAINAKQPDFNWNQFN